jgi:uncharacterized protein YbaP (TraB family)
VILPVPGRIFAGFTGMAIRYTPAPMKLFASATAIAAILLSSCAQAGSTESGHARPALWRLADEDTTIWLFGTIHVLPKDYRWRGKKLDAAFSSSNELVVEAVLDRDPRTSAALLMSLGRATAKLPPLIDRVRPEKRATLQDMITRSKLPIHFLDGLETWAAALMLVGVTLTDLGLDSNTGVEQMLEAEFKMAGKPIDGLEKPEQQLGYFDALPEESQRDFLETLLDDPDAAREDFDKMLKAWSRGDEAGIAATFDDEIELSPRLRDVLLKSRNAAWTAWLKQRLETPGTVLVAVGAGHLSGPMSVQSMLKAEGLKVERVQ